MELYKRILDDLKEFKTLKNDIEKNKTPIMVSGVSNINKAHFIYSISLWKTDQNILILVPDERYGKKLVDDLNSMADFEKAFLYPSRDFIFKKIDIVSKEYEHLRLGVLSNLLNGGPKIIVCSVEAALQQTLPIDVLKNKIRKLEKFQSISMDKIIQYLVEAGYSKRSQIDGIAQFSVRGDIVDYFSPNFSKPVRVEFFGDEIDNLSYFDIYTQRRAESIQEVFVIPVNEVLIEDKNKFILNLQDIANQLVENDVNNKLKKSILSDVENIKNGIEIVNIDKYFSLIYEEKTTIFDYFKKSLIFLTDYKDIMQKAENCLFQHHEDLKILIEDGDIPGDFGEYYINFSTLESFIQRNPLVFLEIFPVSFPNLSFKSEINVKAIQNNPWNGNFKFLVEDLKDYINRGYGCIVLSGTEKSAPILAEDLVSEGIECSYVKDVNENYCKGKAFVLKGGTSSGFEYPDIKSVLITNNKVNISKNKLKKQNKLKGEEIRSLSDLTEGDAVVHVSHGIGIFDGINKLDLHGVVKDYIKIKYSGSDILYLPVTQLDLVSKYIGPKENNKIKLNKLNSGEWQKTRTRVKQAVDDMADELIKLYAERAKTKGYSFSEDSELQKDFEAHFPYEETGDQLRCIREIKKDMQKDSPMDRLLCGDVGFGKTEVALRAAFKCVLDGKQCAILCPTTILSWQHYQNILERVGEFPVNIELLSRFRNKNQQKKIIENLAMGNIDIVIGTHRLVQKDIEFKDLGLAVIDEEQRFGVAHKEKFKEMFKEIDILTLSATPIPRTLNMAMSGIRDMSVIEEAPQDRYPIQTYVLEHNMSFIADVIEKELRRNGQVYYIHNKIETIDSCANRILELIPDARIGIAHGRMGEQELSSVWKNLIEKEIDILVCTTIIETGVDVANCNTLVIENADKMGLSQLYQLRGRIGRSNRRAFAYFTFDPDKSLTEISSKRLAAIKEFTQFGSGFKIALRDLEIRGAGNILGSKQHGHMESVGYDMYVKLLSEAMKRKKGEVSSKSSIECLVDIRIDAYIPQTYIGDISQRLDIYRKIASIKTKKDSLDIIDELIDRFGEPSQSVKGLVDVALLRNTAARHGFFEITQKSNSIIFSSKSIDINLVENLTKNLKGRVMLNAGTNPYLVVKIPKDTTPISTIREVLQVLQDE